MLWLVVALLAAAPALALEPAIVEADADRIDISSQSEYFEARGDRLQVDTAAGPDGVAGRMEVKAIVTGTNPRWAVFALRNTTDRPIERWLAAERYSIIGSGLVLPDLDSSRVAAVTPSVGFVPERVPNDRADVFRITLDPGVTVTFVAELNSDRTPQLYLWKPSIYELKLRERTLFNGIMLGITGLIAIFLTAIFAANHQAIFPAAALVAWAALAYLCVEFGFWHKVFQLSADDNAVYRAATEAAIAASLVVFLYTFLKLGLWHSWVRLVFMLWIAAQVSLVGAALLDPQLVATLARASFVIYAGLGSLLLLYLAARGQDRALTLVPSWLLFLVWLFALGAAITGRLNGDIVVSGIVAGLVLIVTLLSFTVMQFGFRSFEPLYGGGADTQSRSLAIDAANAAIWEWSSRRDEIETGALIEEVLGLNQGDLSCKTDDWVKHLHQSDRERFRLALLAVQEKNGGSLQIDLRMRRSDSSYRWFELRAGGVPQLDQRSLKCIGLLRDITGTKRAHERLVHDAVHDSLTGLPNRELFLDRLSVALIRAKEAGGSPPIVMLIDVDRFKNVNSAFGIIVGDSMLLTIARRLSRHLDPQDTLSRLGGDQFAVLLATTRAAGDVKLLAERVRRSLRSPMKIGGKEIILTGSIGIAVYDGVQKAPEEVLREAEAAMYRAKRAGSDRIEVFQASMRAETDQRVALESELRLAIERKQIKVLYQPVLRIDNDELAGFEALIRWDHPTLGQLNPIDFMPMATEADLMPKLGNHVLERAVKEAAKWQKELPRLQDPLFVSVNISSRDLFRQELVQDLRAILGRETVPRGCVRLEVTESLVMENPEQAADVLEWLKSAGAGLSIDDFGTGYSSLAYLGRFAFDTIKIDRSLVHDASTAPAGAAIVRSIVALAHELGKTVVAEGVETEEDASFLRTVGCEYAQGFLYGEPMTDKEVFGLLAELRKEDRRAAGRGGLFSALLKRTRRRLGTVSEPHAAAAREEMPVRGVAATAVPTARFAAMDRRSPPGAVPTGVRPAPATVGGMARPGPGPGAPKARLARPDALAARPGPDRRLANPAPISLGAPLVGSGALPLGPGSSAGWPTASAQQSAPVQTGAALLRSVSALEPLPPGSLATLSRRSSPAEVAAPNRDSTPMVAPLQVDPAPAADAVPLTASERKPEQTDA